MFALVASKNLQIFHNFILLMDDDDLVLNHFSDYTLARNAFE